MSKIKKIILVVLITVILIVPFSVSALSIDEVTIKNVSNFKGDVIYSYDGYFYPSGSRLYGTRQFSFYNDCWDFVLDFNGIPKTVSKGDKIVFEGEFIFEAPAKTFSVSDNCDSADDFSYKITSFIDPEYTLEFKRVTFSFSTTITQNKNGYRLLLNTVGTGGMKYFYIKSLTFSLESDPSYTIIENQDQNTDKIIDNQDQNTEEIKQAINEQAQTEKQEAQSSGNAAMDSVTSVIPNYAGNLSNYFTALTKRMIHEDLTCFITFPEIKIPAINGFFKETVLSEKKTINMAEAASLIPTKILYLVRYLLTLFLIIYCFKELYSIIQYVMTLKGGNLDE